MRSRRTSLVLPARSAMCLYSGTPFSAAPAFATASDTARIALAPSLPCANDMRLLSGRGYVC